MPDRRAHTACIILSEHLSNHYVGPLIRGAVAAAAELGVRLILYSPLSIYLDRRDFSLADLPLLPRPVDSYLVPANIADEVVALCRRTGAALLTYAGERSGLPTIGPDNRAGARAATAHLIGHGRRRIVHLAGLPDSVEAHERLAGYRDALAEAGIPFDPALVAYGHFRVQEAEDAMAQLLRAGVRFDAIFAANDLEARGALHVLAQAGVRVPEDVAIVGFDDAAGSDVERPPLTTVRQSAFQIGWDALALLAGSADQPLPERTLVPVQLVVRRSCGCDPAGAPAGWAEQLAARLGTGQAPLVAPAEVVSWTEPLEQALDGLGELDAAVADAVGLLARRGANVSALRHYIELWRGRRLAEGADPWWAAGTAAAAKDTLADLLEARAAQDWLDRGSRLNAITYVLDLLREYNYEQATEPVLRYIVGCGPLAAVGAQRTAAAETISGQLVTASGVAQWQGPAAEFPPREWLWPGEVMLLMPMRSGAQQSMLFGVVEREGRAHVDLDDQLLRAINTYRSISVLNATLQELDAARSVQLRLLPSAPPPSERYDIAGATRTARQVGGDLYGYYPRPGDELALALGDVAGKGMPAALLMSACATALAGTIVQAGLPPGRTLTEVHKLLQPSVSRGQNAAICLAYLDGPRARIANAGAVAPILLRHGGARLVDVGGLPLGTPLSGLLPYAEVEVELAPGDTLILTSDGIVEAMNEAGEIYGFERLLASVAGCAGASAQALLDRLLADVAAFSGEAEIHDDMAIVVARFKG